MKNFLLITAIFFTNSLPAADVRPAIKRYCESHED